MTTQLLERHPVTPEQEWADILDALTRREFLAGGAALGALRLGIGASGGSSSHDNEAGKGWTYTDDLGRTVHVAERPRRIASLDDSTTATLWSAGLHVVASQLAPGNRSMLTAAGVPERGITKIAAGNTNGINLEALAAAKPDLIIDVVIDHKLAAVSTDPHVAKVAPVVGLAYGPTLAAIIGGAHRLTAALAVRVTDTGARARYQAAAGRLRQALAAKSGLRVAFFDAYGGTFYTNGPTQLPFLATLAGLGMTFMEGSGRKYSWELVPGLPADLFLQSDGQWPISTLAWKATPAVRAGQYADTDHWGAGWYLYDYANYATMFDRLTAAVEKAKPDVGPH